MVSDREVSARLENDRDYLLQLDLVFRDRRVSASSLAVTTISRTAAAVANTWSNWNIDDSQGGLPAALPSSGMS